MARTRLQTWTMHVLAVMLILPAGLSRAADPGAIDTAINKARAYLYRMQKQETGTWERGPLPDPKSDRTDPAGGQFGGTTALCVFALLCAGENHDDERLKPAIDFLLKARLTGVYAISMRVLVLDMLPQSAQVKAAMQRDMQFLRRAMITSGGARGFYDYEQQERSDDRIDHSVSQFAVLAAWVCSERMESFGPDYWKIVDTAWRSTQHAQGSWSYAKAPSAKAPATVAMTAAGVATLFITQDYLNRGRTLDPLGNVRDANIDKGIKWIGDNYKNLLNDTGTAQNYPYYGLFGVERIGLASGYRFIGGVNWYDDGAAYLLKNQNTIGGWEGTINTALSLLFLSRGRAPVAMNKLNYEIIGQNNRVSQANWNQRPRDAANLAKYIGRQAERTINWQVIDFSASVDDMLDAPILYISGNQPLTFTDAQKQKLKEYVQNGGLILGHADASSVGFANTFKRMAMDLFDYEFRALPAGHTIYTDEQFSYDKWRRKPSVLGMSNGVRELFLLLPEGDPARYWQAYDITAHNELFEMAADVFQYAVDKQNLRFKGDRYIVRKDDKIIPTRAIKLARVKYQGNWDPEPAGWVRLANIFNNDQKIQLNAAPVEVSRLGQGDAKIAHITGTGPIRFDDAQRTAIKAFVGGGGLLIVDSAGGSAQFSQSMEQEFQAIFGEPAAVLRQPLPADHKLYTIGGKLQIGYRPYAQRNLTGDLKVGRLRMMQLNNKPAVIYSPEDLSEGLVGQPVDGVLGYTPGTAAGVMSNILLYATQ